MGYAKDEALLSNLSPEAMKIVFKRMKVEDCRRHSRSSFPRKITNQHLLDTSLQRLTLNVDGSAATVTRKKNLIKTAGLV